MAQYDGPAPNSQFFDESNSRCERGFFFGFFPITKENIRNVYDSYPNQPIPILKKGFSFKLSGFHI